MAKAKKAGTPPLIEAIRDSRKDGDLVSTVLSTYGLSLDNFFEQDFLPALFGLGTVKDRGLTVPVTLERKLKESYTALVCDAHALAQGARPSLQIDVLPIKQRTNHAKVVLIHRKRLVRLVIASANLTSEGYRLQREISAILDFHEEGKVPASVLRKAVDGWVEVLGDVATPIFRQTLEDAVHRAESWQHPLLPADHDIAVVFGGGAKPLYQTLVEAWPEREPLLDWYVCSPFWPDPGGITPFEAIAEGLTARGTNFDEASLTVIACGDSPGERTQPRFPFGLVRHLRESDFPVRRGQIIPARLETLTEEVPENMAENRRELHAKWVLLRGPTTAVVLLGSANFTRKGLGVGNPANANIEACVLLRLPADSVSPKAWMPPVVEKGIVEWDRCAEEDLKPVGEEEDLPLDWPAFIHRIELKLRWAEGPDPLGQLTIVPASGPFPGFTLSLPAEDGGSKGQPIAEIPGGESLHLLVPVDASAVRRILTRRSVVITWDSPLKSTAFPVNLDQESKDGLPSVLGARPDEQQLLAYFHGRITEEDLVEHLERRAREGDGGSGLSAQEAERLKHLQSYLLRDFIESLFGLADTLHQATCSSRAFQQALLGEFSPVSLARQILEALRSGRRSPTAAAFQLVELLRVVATLDLSDQTASSPDEREALEEARAAGVKGLLEMVGQAASVGEFQEVCKEKDFTSYVKMCLPDHLDAWNNTVFKAPVKAAAVTESAEGVSVP